MSQPYPDPMFELNVLAAKKLDEVLDAHRAAFAQYEDYCLRLAEARDDVINAAVAMREASGDHAVWLEAGYRLMDVVDRLQEVTR